MFVNSLAALNSRVPTSLPSRSSPNVTSTPKRTTARYVRRNSSQVGAIVLRVRVSSALELPVADCSCTYLSRHTRRGGCLLLLVCLVAWVCLCVHVDSIFGCRALFVLFFPRGPPSVGLWPRCMATGANAVPCFCAGCTGCLPFILRILVYCGKAANSTRSCRGGGVHKQSCQRMFLVSFFLLQLFFCWTFFLCSSSPRLCVVLNIVNRRLPR